MTTIEPYAIRHARNTQRLIQLQLMRKEGQGSTAAYRALKRLALRQYRLLTEEACMLHRKININEKSFL